MQFSVSMLINLLGNNSLHIDTTQWWQRGDAINITWHKKMLLMLHDEEETISGEQMYIMASVMASNIANGLKLTSHQII